MEMMPLSQILRKCTGGYKLSKSLENMDNITLFAKKMKNELDTLIQTIRIYPQDRDGIWH